MGSGSFLLSAAAFASLPCILTAIRMRNKDDDDENCRRIAEALGVVPHPEGGYFIETYRSGGAPMASRGLTDISAAGLATDREGSMRNYMTSIIFMATRRAPKLYFGINRSDHVHYYHGGDSYTYIVVHPSGSVEEVVLGRDVLRGEMLQIVFPAGCLKAGHLNGTYCLIGEGVAPGFDFRDFEFADENQLLARLAKGENGQDLAERYVAYVKPDRRRNFDDYYHN